MSCSSCAARALCFDISSTTCFSSFLSFFTSAALTSCASLAALTSFSNWFAFCLSASAAASALACSAFFARRLASSSATATRSFSMTRGRSLRCSNCRHERSLDSCAWSSRMRFSFSCASTSCFCSYSRTDEMPNEREKSANTSSSTALHFVVSLSTSRFCASLFFSSTRTSVCASLVAASRSFRSCLTLASLEAVSCASDRALSSSPLICSNLWRNAVMASSLACTVLSEASSRCVASACALRVTCDFSSHRFARARSWGDEPPVMSPALLISVPSSVTTLKRSSPE
mmetsp:Transcript_7374/g.22148  ORF Transcript_7374/g.22148 Transcript_7374/m.22148 type:complete len:288 (+) Transcript_7374:680-1543(+)